MFLCILCDFYTAKTINAHLQQLDDCTYFLKGNFSAVKRETNCPNKQFWVNFGANFNQYSTYH